MSNKSSKRTRYIAGLHCSVCLNLKFRRIIVESMKAIQFWKAYGTCISNQTNNVSICPEFNMAAILYFTKWPP